MFVSCENKSSRDYNCWTPGNYVLIVSISSLLLDIYITLRRTALYNTKGIFICKWYMTKPQLQPEHSLGVGLFIVMYCIWVLHKTTSTCDDES